MTQTAPCTRCGRTMEFDDHGPIVDAVCIGCLTAEEDVDDTLAFVEAAPEVSGRALANLQRRQGSGEVVRRALAPEPGVTPPIEADPVESGRRR